MRYVQNVTKVEDQIIVRLVISVYCTLELPFTYYCDNDDHNTDPVKVVTPTCMIA